MLWMTWKLKSPLPRRPSFDDAMLRFAISCGEIFFLVNDLVPTREAIAANASGYATLCW